MREISVIIVSWNACGYLRDCLASIRATGATLVREVIVVDNASSDGSPEMVANQFPEAKLIRSNENLGFARANNLGLRHASSPLLALINSDVVVHAKCFQELASQFELDSGTGLVGPKVFGRDGALQLSCGWLPTLWNTACEFLLLYRFFPRWSLCSGYQMRNHDLGSRTHVETLSGCFWLARREAIEEVGGLDERFFFYAEDIDWCKRFADAGWKLKYVPEATATHFGGGSSGNAPLRYSIELLRANLLYWQKHHGGFGKAAYFLLAMAQHSFRFVVRGLMRITGLANGDETKMKIREHMTCVRWLLTGKGA